MIRNLLYNCCALEHSEEWRLNIEELCHFPDAFNGRRLILIKTGPKIVDPEIVEAEFAPLGECEFIRWPNDLKIHEVAGFIETLGKLESLNSDEALFYAHTKGTKYQTESRNIGAIRKWRKRMLHECLRDPAKIEEILETYHCAGCYIVGQITPPVPSTARWHFSGTFWWVRHDALFSTNWKNIVQHTHGVEAYLGERIPIDKAFCLYNEDVESGGLYKVVGRFLCENCGHEFEKWMKLRENPKKVCPKCFKRAGVYVDTVQDEDIDW